MQPDERDLTPRRIAAIGRRRAPVVILCVVIAVAAALAYSLNAQKKYTATAAVLFNNSPLSQQIAGLQAVPNTSPQSQQDTNLQLLTLGDLARVTAQRVGHGLTRGLVASSISVSPSGDTTVVDVSATLPSARLAADVANTYANQFVSEQENGNRSYYESALATVEAQLSKLSPQQVRGTQGLALQNRAQSLATLAQIRSGTVQLVQPAGIPSAPSAPTTRRNLIIAAVLGIMLGVALALVSERLDQNIREPEDLELFYGLPLLGAIPQSSSLRRSSRARRGAPPSSAVSDAFQYVRARLRYFNVDRDLRTLAVVSAQPEDGKTTIAHWLAHAAGATGSRVLLMETDLRKPTLAHELGLELGPGVADVLIGAFTFEDALQQAELNISHKGSEAPRALDVMVAGAPPPNPAEMLESHAMAELLSLARSRYDLVVLDTAPLGAVSDALPLVRTVDGVAIVAAMNRIRRDTARRLKATLDSVDAPLLGVIANRVKARDGTLYGYGYGSSPDDNSSYEVHVPTSEIQTQAGRQENVGGSEVVPEGGSARPVPASGTTVNGGEVVASRLTPGTTDSRGAVTARASARPESGSQWMRWRVALMRRRRPDDRSL